MDKIWIKGHGRAFRIQVRNAKESSWTNAALWIRKWGHKCCSLKTLILVSDQNWTKLGLCSKKVNTGGSNFRIEFTQNVLTICCWVKPFNTRNVLPVNAKLMVNWDMRKYWPSAYCMSYIFAKPYLTSSKSTLVRYLCF